jgi:hypothetical protein
MTPQQPVPNRKSKRLPVRRTRSGRPPRGLDEIAVEEPLEIRLRWNHQAIHRDELISTTMRTPGDDFDLAVGFLVAEGLLGSTESPAGVTHCTDGSAEEPLNVVTVILKDGSDPDLDSLTPVSEPVPAASVVELGFRMSSLVFPRLPVINTTNRNGSLRCHLDYEWIRDCSRVPVAFTLPEPGPTMKRSRLRCVKMLADTMPSTNWWEPSVLATDSPPRVWCVRSVEEPVLNWFKKRRSPDSMRWWRSVLHRAWRWKPLVKRA